MLLLFSFLTADTSFGQFLRIPTLIHHYLEHVKWDNSTFYEFLCEHYAAKINHPDDKHHDHENLPFKTLNCHATHVLNIAPQIWVLSEPNCRFVEEKIGVLRTQFCQNLYLNTIWQPPRCS